MKKRETFYVRKTPELPMNLPEPHKWTEMNKNGKLGFQAQLDNNTEDSQPHLAAKYLSLCNTPTQFS